MKDIKDVSPGTPDGCEECLKARSRWLHLRYLIDRIEALPNVEIHRSAQINALEGDNRLRTVSIRRADGSEMRIRCGSLFMFIGANARTGWLKECVQLDDKGFVVTGTALRAPACASTRSADADRDSYRTDDGTSAPAPVRSAVQELIRADETFSTAANELDLATGISAMFAPDVAMPVPGSRFTKTRDEAITALRAVPGSATSHASWGVANAGVSADGQHGFTAGFMSVSTPGATHAPFKYLAYWVKRPEGWRVAVYRRRPSPLLEKFQRITAPLPNHMVSPTTDAASIDRFRESLDNAERSFSLDAQTTGLKAAFTKWGTADSWNMGGPADTTFVMGAGKIGNAVGDGEPAESSSVFWAPERVIVASSGDFGVTMGTIHLHKPAADGSQNAGFAFFTVWRRANTTQPWRYIAE